MIHVNRFHFCCSKISQDIISVTFALAFSVSADGYLPSGKRKKFPKFILYPGNEISLKWLFVMNSFMNEEKFSRLVD